MIEKHVTSLELSKRLKELGALQESYFFWHEFNLADFEEGESVGTLRPEMEWHLTSSSLNTDGAGHCSAFLASELGEMLPPAWYRTHVWLQITRQWNQEAKNHAGKWIAAYDPEPSYDQIGPFMEDSMPNALAKLLIHLIEQGIVKPGVTNE